MDLKYKLVIDFLQNLFVTKQYKDGDKLPTETALMESLNVGRNTIRKAIIEMEKQNLVIRKQGSGTFYIHNDQLELKSRGLIGLVNFHGMEYIYSEIINGIEETLYNSGFSSLIANNNLKSLRDLSSLKLLLDQDVKGLIMDLSLNFPNDIEDPMIDLVRSVNIPVITTHWNGSMTEFSTVSLNDEHGGYEATKYLIENGHRKIGIIFKENVQAGIQRFEGYKKALQEFGITFNMSLVKSFLDNLGSEYEQVIGGRLTEELLDEKSECTAIFYFNDQTAMAGYEALAKRGVKIPDDISVIGFDNYKHARLLSPPLTTIDHPKKQLGNWAAKLLINEIEDNSILHHKSLVFEPVLIERKSVKKISG